MKNLIYSIILLVTFFISACGPSRDDKRFDACRAHADSCPLSEDCPEHPLCEAHEKCEKDKDCKEHPDCEAFEHV